MVAQENGSHPSTAERLQRVQALQHQLQTWEDRPSPARGVVRSNCAPLDALFPAGGALRGSLVEWLSRGPGTGAAALALAIACRACQEGGLLVVVDARGWFYPPAVAAWNLPWQQLMVVRPPDRRTHLWAVDQALRSPAVAAVWTELGQVDGRDFRRLQLAARQGGTLGLLLRGGAGRGQPSWSDVRLAVHPAPPASGWELEVQRLGGRGAAGPQQARLEIDTTTGTIRTPGEDDPDGAGPPPRERRAPLLPLGQPSLWTEMPQRLSNS
jgi:hypothetical protein